MVLCCSKTASHCLKTTSCCTNHIVMNQLLDCNCRVVRGLLPGHKMADMLLIFVDTSRRRCHGSHHRRGLRRRRRTTEGRVAVTAARTRTVILVIRPAVQVPDAALLAEPVTHFTRVNPQGQFARQHVEQVRLGNSSTRRSKSQDGVETPLHNSDTPERAALERLVREPVVRITDRKDRTQAVGESGQVGRCQTRS